MRAAHEASEPVALGDDEWHLPLIRPEDREQVDSLEVLLKVSAGRCARVSYLTHAGERDLSADVELHDRLISSGHMSPLEHPAQPADDEWCGNFHGWRPYRKTIAGEANPLASGGALSDDLSDVQPFDRPQARALG
jgi:hypothetical protein